MKSNIHPKYYTSAKVLCSCGESFETGSTLPEIKVEICSACHPFFTGEMKFIDTQGRVEKFEAARQKAQSAQQHLTDKKKAEQAQQSAQDYEPKTLKEMMQDVAKAQTETDQAKTQADTKTA